MSAPMADNDVTTDTDTCRSVDVTDQSTGIETERVSALGTKAHWDSFYEKEIVSFLDVGDIGHNWYGESCMQRILKWIGINVKKKDAHILDLGCGNGVLLTELNKQGYECLTGVDYSEGSIHLAHSVAKVAGLNILFKLADILNISRSILESQKFDVCIDKGTYDAILLAPGDRDKLRKLYRENVSHVLMPEGILILASGNYTRSELTEFFMPEFEVVEDIPAPTFSFGGENGTTVTTVILHKKTIKVKETEKS